MPLVKCPDCGREVSTRAPTCPQCGASIASEVEKDRREPGAVPQAIPPGSAATHDPGGGYWSKSIKWAIRGVAVAAICAPTGAAIGFASSPDRTLVVDMVRIHEEECRPHPGALSFPAPDLGVNCGAHYTAENATAEVRERRAGDYAGVGACVGLVPAVPAIWFLILFVLSSLSAAVRSPSP